ncbi:MAG: septal ring lytic transglycosylase RlpA family protein [Planctomycetes bacterium]|nr:septal ring lytic transglycosylase RlpA family protein [Planctomycetota bacterium]
MENKNLNSPQLLWLPLLMVIITLTNNFSIATSTITPFKPAVAAAPTLSRTEQVVYTVEPGDSWAKVAVLYKVNLSDLKSWNRELTGKVLCPGDKILVKRIEYPSVEGLASWYGPGFHGQNMANGQVYDMNDIVVAHRSLPLGRKVLITNLENGKSIIAPVLDRGPYVKNSRGEYTREIDLSYGVAKELDTIKKGVVLARVEPLEEPWPAE